MALSCSLVLQSAVPVMADAEMESDYEAEVEVVAEDAVIQGIESDVNSDSSINMAEESTDAADEEVSEKNISLDTVIDSKTESEAESESDLELEDDLETVLDPAAATDYYIYFDENGGVGTLTSQNGDATQTLSQIVPEKIGYNFYGWSTTEAPNTADLEYKPSQEITLTDKSTTLYAIWEEGTSISGSQNTETYSDQIRYFNEWRSFNFTPQTSGYYHFEVSSDQAAEIDIWGDELAYMGSSADETPSMDRYFEAGKNYDICVSLQNSTETGTFTLKMQKIFRLKYQIDVEWNMFMWEDILAGQTGEIPQLTPFYAYNIQYDANGGNCDVTFETIEVDFKSWNDQQDGSGNNYTPGAAFTANSNLTLYPVWQETAYGTLPNAKRDGYTFQGWFLEKEDGSEAQQITAESMMTGDATLVAHWEDATPFEIITQPDNAVGGLNAQVAYTVEATGKDLVYEWQYQKAGAAKWLVSGATGAKTDTISFKISTSNKGNSFRCKITDAYGKVQYTDVVGIDFVEGAVITRNPQSQVAVDGETAIFTVEAEHVAEGGYQWQYSKDGAHWYNSGAEGNNTDTLYVPANIKSQGNRYRCVVTGNDSNKKKSLGCAMIVLTEGPVDTQGVVGEEVTFSLKTEGIETYLWQYSKDGGNTWYKSGAAGADTDTITFTVNQKNIGMLYRCKLTTEDGASAFTKAVELYE